MLRPFLLFVLVLCIFLGGGIFGYSFFESINSYTQKYLNKKQIADVPVVPERSYVTCLGRIEPKGKVLSISVPTGTRIERVVVKEGEYVKAGQTLAYLIDYERCSAEVQYIQSKLQEAKISLAAAKNYAQALVQEAEIQEETQYKEQNILIENQERQVELAKTDLGYYEQEYNRLKQQKESISSQQLDQQKYLYKKSQEQFHLASGTLNLLKVQLATKILINKAKVRTAISNLEQVISSAPIESLEKNLQLAQRQLDLLIVKAPGPGQIFKILVRNGESVLYDPILKMGDTSQMYASAEVYETDVRLIQAGMKAEIESQALSRKISGVVETVGYMIAKNNILDVEPSSRMDARVLEARILLDADPHVARMNNLQVKVKIHLDGKK